MNAIVKTAETTGGYVERAQPTQLPSGAVLVSQADAFLAMIERASRDPAVDIEKFRQLMLMKQEVEARAAEGEFDNCMADAQSEMVPVIKNEKNSQTNSKYASYDALDAAIRPIYTRHGFSLSFYTGEAKRADDIRIYCKVAHRGGHTERPYIDMPADGKGAKGGDVMTRTHATMSASSYGKRGLLGMVFNIATKKEDDDGNKAGGKTDSPITAAQADQIRELALAVKVDMPAFLEFFGADSIPEIKASRFRQAMNMLNQKRARETAA